MSKHRAADRAADRTADQPRLLQQLWTLLVTPLLPVILMLALALPLPQAALAGPVDWHEVPATSEGRQWWDAGSLRLNRNGNLTVLSRFQPAAGEAESQRPPANDLYVMEVDCGQPLAACGRRWPDRGNAGGGVRGRVRSAGRLLSQPLQHPPA